MFVRFVVFFCSLLFLCYSSFVICCWLFCVCVLSVVCYVFAHGWFCFIRSLRFVAICVLVFALCCVLCCAFYWLRFGCSLLVVTCCLFVVWCCVSLFVCYSFHVVLRLFSVACYSLLLAVCC